MLNTSFYSFAKRHTQPPHGSVRRKIPLSFLLGLLVGVLASGAFAFLFALGALNYIREKGQGNAATFAWASDDSKASDRVELYFPLERFLTWRSTDKLSFGMQGDKVQIRYLADLIPHWNIRVTVDVFGVPSVIHGYFTLSQVSGDVNHIPVPRSLLLDAIAANGSNYGVHVNDARDSIMVEKTFGPYRLVGYDGPTKDLIISLPVETVEHAARGQPLA